MHVKVNGEFKEYDRKFYEGKEGKLVKAFPDDGSIFFRYPQDESAFSANFGLRFFYVPTGYVAVNKWFGKVSRKRPLKADGLRMMIGIAGFGQSAHVVNVRPRTEDLEVQNVITRDNVPIMKIDSTLNYIIYDPARAIAAEDYRHTTFEKASGEVVNYIGNNTLENLLYAVDRSERNLTLELIDEKTKKWEPIKFEEVENVGVKMLNLFITNVEYHAELRVPLAGKAIGEAEKARRISNEEAEYEEIQKRGAAIVNVARAIVETPGALELRRFETYDEFAQGPNNTFSFLPSSLNVNINMEGRKEGGEETTPITTAPTNVR